MRVQFQQGLRGQHQCYTPKGSGQREGQPGHGTALHTCGACGLALQGLESSEE